MQRDDYLEAWDFRTTQSLPYSENCTFRLMGHRVRTSNDSIETLSLSENGVTSTAKSAMSELSWHTETATASALLSCFCFCFSFSGFFFLFVSFITDYNGQWTSHAQFLLLTTAHDTTKLTTKITPCFASGDSANRARVSNK